ncbi:Pyridoxine 5'-phosphate synthase [compost metagenome]
MPEKREEVTTEGGLDVIGNREAVEKAVRALKGAGILVSLFIDPAIDQVRASHEVGADAVELHTGAYAEAFPHADAELARLQEASQEVRALGLRLHAGHGLTYWNVRPVAEIPGMAELNIGHSLIARAVLVGMERAVREMKDAMLGR